MPSDSTRIGWSQACGRAVRRSRAKLPACPENSISISRTKFAAIWIGRRSERARPLSYRLRAAAFSACTALCSAVPGAAPVIAAAAPTPAAAVAESRPAAELIIHNARIWTVSPKQPEADALAVLNGRFVAVGTEAEVMRWQGPHTRIVDAQGNRLLPGFNDAHVHF